MGNNILIELENYTESCGEKVLLDDISIKIPSGGIFSITGGPRSDKSLLAKSIVGLVANYISLHGSII